MTSRPFLLSLIVPTETNIPILEARSHFEKSYGSHLPTPHAFELEPVIAANIGLVDECLSPHFCLQKKLTVGGCNGKASDVSTWPAMIRTGDLAQVPEHRSIRRRQSQCAPVQDCLQPKFIIEPHFAGRKSLM